MDYFKEFCRSHKLGPAQRRLFYDWLVSAGFGDPTQMLPESIFRQYPRFCSWMATQILNLRAIVRDWPGERL